MKIQPLFELGMFSNYRICTTLEKYLPESVVFTGEYEKPPGSYFTYPRWEIDTSCDAYIFHATPDGDSYRKLFWGEKDWVITLMEEVGSKPSIILFEAFYPLEEIPKWIKDKDIVQSYREAAFLPEHPNLISYPMPGSGRWIDESIFYRKEEMEKTPNRIIVASEHLQGNNSSMNQSLSFFGHPVHYLGTYDENFLRSEGDTCSKVMPDHSEELNDLYNTMDYAVNLLDRGYESWLVEARFCGVKCYYPDVSVYRSLFGDENVGFFDLEDIEGTLNLENDMTESDIVYSRQKWGAEHRVPIFWEEVRNRITPEHLD